MGCALSLEILSGKLGEERGIKGHLLLARKGDRPLEGERGAKKKKAWAGEMSSKMVFQGT